VKNRKGLSKSLIGRRTPYDRAPIREAIIDFRVTSSATFDVRDLQKSFASELKNYPDFIELNQAEGAFMLGPSISAAATQSHIGYLMRNSQYVCQLKDTGFTLSRMHPYSKWEEFRDEARRLWSKYREVRKPDKIERLAVRYINKIEMPAPIEKVDEYFQTFPLLSSESPSDIEHYFMRIVVRLPDIQAKAILSEVLLWPPNNDGIQSIVLDIDVFRDTEVPTAEKDIWKFFEKLRLKKNVLFENSITDKSRALFNDAKR